MWIGTAKGLNKINLSNDSITLYLQQPGLPNDFITIATVHDLLSTKRPEENLKLDGFIVKLSNELVVFMDADVQLNFNLIPLMIKKNM